MRTHALHKRHLSVYAARARLLTTAMVAGDFECAITQCEELVDTMALVYRAEHPMLGLQLYTLGNLRHNQGEYEAAVGPLSKAYTNLGGYLGHEHPMVAGLSRMLKEARTRS
jgi:hypothetical protein